MVAGHTQAIDGAPVKANASMDSLELKVPAEQLDDYIRQHRVLSTKDRIAKENKASKEQQSITASEKELNDIKNRNDKWKKDQDQRPGAGRPGSKYTSNKTHYSPTDPDARISVKPGKARKLNYNCQMAVDTSNHVITHIHADFADKKDNQCLDEVVGRLKERLNRHGLLWRNCLADAGYSSGENYAMLEEECLVPYIPPHGTYKGGPDGFTFDKEQNGYVCQNGKLARFRKTFTEKGTLKNQYATQRKDCRDCPFKTSCIGNGTEKRFNVTFYREEYERVKNRLKTPLGKRAKAQRQSTVEPVFGSLKEFFGLRKINTIGILQANKKMLLAGAAYNLKKLIKHNLKNQITLAGTKTAQKAIKRALHTFICVLLKPEIV